MGNLTDSEGGSQEVVISFETSTLFLFLQKSSNFKDTKETLTLEFEGFDMSIH